MTAFFSCFRGSSFPGQFSFRKRKMLARTKKDKVVEVVLYAIQKHVLLWCIDNGTISIGRTGQNSVAEIFFVSHCSLWGLPPPPCVCRTRSWLVWPSASSVIFSKKLFLWKAALYSQGPFHIATPQVLF